MPPKSSHYRMADRLAGGNLEQTLLSYRDAGLSPDAIAARLYAEHGIETTGTTVTAWLKPDPDPEPLEATADVDAAIAAVRAIREDST